MLETLCCTCMSHWWQDLMTILNLSCWVCFLGFQTHHPFSEIHVHVLGKFITPIVNEVPFFAFCWVEYSNFSYVSFLAQTCQPLCSWPADSAHETHGYAINFVPVGPGFQAASNDSHTTDSLPCFCSDQNCLEGRIILCCCWVWFICPRKQPCSWASDFR